MELYAFSYATEKKYSGFPVYKSRPNKIAMKDLFNMTAGTSTGSILAAGLVYPNNKNISEPKFFATDLLEIYSERGKEIFVKKSLSGVKTFLYCMLWTVMFGVIGYYFGMLWFDNPEMYESFTEMRQVVKYHKKEVSGKKAKTVINDKVADMNYILKS